MNLEAFVVKAPSNTGEDPGHNFLVQANDSNVVNVDIMPHLKGALGVKNHRSAVIMEKLALLSGRHLGELMLINTLSKNKLHEKPMGNEDGKGVR